MLRTDRMISLLLLATSLLPTTAQAAKPPKNTPVTTTFAGFGVDTNPVMRLQSDQLGPYTDSSTVVSIIQGSGDWELNLNLARTTPTRSTLFDFRDPVPDSAPGGTNPTPPFAYLQVSGRFICKSSRYGFDTSEMYGVGTTITCPLFPSFQYNGNQYRIDMDGVVASPGSDPALVTCLRVDSANKCNQWRFEPSAVQASGERKNIGRLLRVVTTPKNIVTDLGKFYFSFTIDITKP